MLSPCRVFFVEYRRALDADDIRFAGTREIYMQKKKKLDAAASLLESSRHGAAKGKMHAKYY